VVIACHGTKVSEEVKVESRLAQLGLLRSGDSDDGQASSPGKGWIEMWPLQLESFESVREFAERVSKNMRSLDMLVHNAGTKEGCIKTQDGHELVTQVNYLSPYLLTHLLTPAFREGSRIVHVTCDAALQQKDWLPWPLGRTTAELLPRIDLQGLAQRQEIGNECNSLLEYANSKLAVVVHAHELNRRRSVESENQAATFVVNPGVMDTPFGHSESVPVKKSARSSMMGFLPPVWIAQQVYSFTLGKVVSSWGNWMTRSAQTGAKALFHVATSSALGNEENGGGIGGLYSDKYGAFTDCGKDPVECGLVPLEDQPAAARDEELAVELWEQTEGAIDNDFMHPIESSRKSMPEGPRRTVISQAPSSE
jgi:NAD(P)-dependent dehydrogenase (short-subunit alcohol dehydrogenase family)